MALRLLEETELMGVGDGKGGEWGIEEVGCEWPGTEPEHQRGFGIRSGARVSPCGHWSPGTW